MPDHLLVGLMSGTSLDGVDAALVSFVDGKTKLLCTHEHALPAPLRQTLLTLCSDGDHEIEQMGIADRQLGELFAEAANTLLQKAGVSAAEVAAIGSHGQTIRHRPPGGATPDTALGTTESSAFTLQIGDPNLIAELTGITTVADFRRRDMAAGGQGAPLAPAFHRAMFSNPRQPRAIINLGGIANITTLIGDGGVLGFDCGPANVLMDAWILQHLGDSYDNHGAWAITGCVNSALLKRLLNEPYLKLPAPKSTGRELFNLAWLETHLGQMLQALKPVDVQATLMEYTAQCIRLALEQIGCEEAEIFLCGGGAYNSALLTRLRDLHHPTRVETTQALGIDPLWVEAAAFAWLAQQTLAGLPGNAASVTGARADRVLGAIYAA